METQNGFTGAPEMLSRSRQYHIRPIGQKEEALRPGCKLSSNKNTKEYVRSHEPNGAESSRYGSLRSELRREKGFVVAKAPSVTPSHSFASNISGSTAGHFRSIKSKLKGYRESTYYRRDRYASSIDDEVIYESAVGGCGDTVTTAHETLGSFTVDENHDEALGELTVDDHETNIEVYSTDMHDIFQLSTASSMSTSPSLASSRATEKRRGAKVRKPKVNLVLDIEGSDLDTTERCTNKQQWSVLEQQQEVNSAKINSEARHYNSLYSGVSNESSSSDDHTFCRERSLLDVFSHSEDDEEHEVAISDEITEMRAKTHEFQQRGEQVDTPVPSWQFKPARLEIPSQPAGRTRKVAGGHLSMSRRSVRANASCSSNSAADNNCVEQFLDAAERFEKKKQMGEDDSTMKEPSFFASMSMSMSCLTDNVTEHFSCT